MLPEQPDRLGVRHPVSEPQPEEAHERQPILDLELGLVVRQAVERLQNHDLEHHHRIVRRPATLRAIEYRYAVLDGDVGNRCRELLRETAQAHEMVVHAGSINRDYVHMLVSIPPRLSVSRAVQHLKGRSSHKLLSEFGILRKRYWGQHLWARGYSAATSGNVTDEMWVEYRSRTRAGAR